MIIDGITDATGTGLKDGLIERADMSDAAAGVVVQLISTRANAAWSSSAGAFFVLPLPTTQIITKGASSSFLVSGHYFINDTVSTTFGCGIGFDVSIAGSSWTSIIYPPLHAIYQVDSADTYITQHINKHWIPVTGLSVGTNVQFRLTLKAYYSAAVSFLGNGEGPIDNMSLMIQEIQN